MTLKVGDQVRFAAWLGRPDEVVTVMGITEERFGEALTDRWITVRFEHGSCLTFLEDRLVKVDDRCVSGR